MSVSEVCVCGPVCDYDREGGRSKFRDISGWRIVWEVEVEVERVRDNPPPDFVLHHF